MAELSETVSVEPESRIVAEGSRDASRALRTRVFGHFATSSAVFSVLMVGLEAWLRGPLAVQTLGFAFMALTFFGLGRWVKRSHEAGPASVTTVLVYFLVFFAIERLSPYDSEGIRVAMVVAPVALVLFVGIRWAGFFWLIAAIDAGLITWAQLPALEPMGQGLLVLNRVGGAFVGAILSVLVGAFDEERRAAQRLAEERERDLVEAVARAEDAAAARTRFLANMSHEIRTPMNGVLGLSRLLIDEPLPASSLELARTIHMSGTGLLRVLDDILDLSKLDAGALEIDPRPTDLRRAASDVVQLMSGKASEAGLKLDLEAHPHLPPWALIDGHRVRQILSNLIGNALKFTLEGSVRVRIDPTRTGVRIEVADSGIGMDRPTLDKLFTAFSQAEAGTARRYGGTGLGLAICKQLCDLMGGHIEVRSQPGKGTTFQLDLPAPPCAPPETPLPQSDLRAATRRVLVAEDNRVNQMVIRRFLERLGAVPTLVGDGALAARAAAEHDFDLVLMDLQMPEVDGLEATRRIRELAGPRGKVPIIALTASVMATQREACLQMGMNDVLRKPVELEQLEEQLRKLG